MSFYSQNPFLFSQRQPTRGYGHPFASPTPTHYHSTHDNFDLEEQAALAHLASIRQRREAADHVAQRETAIQAQIAAQREAAFAAAVEREQLREQAIRRALAAREDREQAIRQALVARQEREQAIRQAIAARQEREHAIRQASAVRQEREQAIRQAIAVQEERRSLAIEHHQRQVADRQAQHAASIRAAEEHRRRKECARRCAGSCSKVEKPEKTGQTVEKEDWKQINDVLGALFDINLHEQTEEHESEKKPTVSSSRDTVTKPVEPASAPSATPPSGPAANAAPVEPAVPAQDDPRVVTDLGDLISKYLNVNIEPATETEQSSAGADALTARVNEFLHQFGLEFETESVPVEKKSPKGKEVAEGEKPKQSASPAQAVKPTEPETAATPAEPDSSAALHKLRDISHELHLVTESFTFPTSLAFAPTPSGDETVPALLFNKSNSGYHAQAHKLLQLLLAADGVSSGGDKDVRKQRKAIVKAIEGAIEKLEQKRDAVWTEVKDRRERGEESDDEGSVSSWATESAHEAQHIEHTDAVETADPAEVVPSTVSSQDVDATATALEDAENKSVKGFEIPETTEKGEAADGAAAALNQAEQEKEERQGASDEKDEFELL